MNKSELLANIAAARGRFESILAGFSSAEQSRPLLANGWSVKDVLAHIGWWEQRSCEVVSSLLAGGQPERSIPEEAIDRTNLEIYQASQAVSLEDIRRQEQAAYRQLFDLAEKADEADLFTAGRFAWAQGRRLADWIIWNTYEHFDEHLADLQAWLDQNRKGS